MMWWSGPGWAGWLMMSVGVIAFWAIVVLGGMALVRGLRGDRPAPGGDSPDRARDLLDQRFARGEIDAEEYVRRRDLLKSGR